MRLHLLHVWVACTREGNLARLSTFQVHIMPIPSLPPLLTFVFSLLAADNHAYFRTFVIASIAGIYSLFPLLFTPAGEPYSYSRLFLFTSVTETPISLLYSLLWTALVVRPLSKRVYEYAIPESPFIRASC